MYHWLEPNFIIQLFRDIGWQIKLHWPGISPYYIISMLSAFLLSTSPRSWDPALQNLSILLTLVNTASDFDLITNKLTSQYIGRIDLVFKQ